MSVCGPLCDAGGLTGPHVQPVGTGAPLQHEPPEYYVRDQETEEK